MTCTRRPRTTWTTCLCPPCTEDRNRLTKLARNGYYSRIPSDVGWQVIDRLRAKGWTGQAIASAANLPRYTIERAITADEQGKRRRLSPVTTAALVAHGDPNAGGVGAHGTRRRLQGLARQGYDLQTIADATGIGFSTLASIRNGGSGSFVKARFYVTIRDYTDSLGMTVGPSQLAVKHAIRKGWPGLLAWEDVDDPNESPQGLEEAIDRVAIMQDIADRGGSMSDVLRVIDISRAALQKWAANHGVSPLYRTLAARDSLRLNQWTKGAAA